MFKSGEVIGSGEPLGVFYLAGQWQSFGKTMTELTTDFGRCIHT
jgi:hypothetical protein